MATEKEVLSLVAQLFRENNLTDWQFTFNGAKKRLGYCNSQKKIISVSFPYIQLNTLEQVEETLLHEIAHAKANEEAGYLVGHDERWKKWAIKLGAKPSRCAEQGTYVSVPGKVVYECKNCKREVRRHRKLRNIYACTPCCKVHNDGKFHLDYLLVLKNDKTVNNLPALSSLRDNNLFNDSGGKQE